MNEKSRYSLQISLPPLVSFILHWGRDGGDVQYFMIMISKKKHKAQA